MDRTLAPGIERVTEISVPSTKPREHIGAVPVFAVEDNSEDLTKVEFTFPAGTGEEPKPLLATSVSSMLLEGTASFTAGEINELKDFYGAKIQVGVGKDTASVSLVCLRQNLVELVPLLASVIQEPTFPEKEFEGYKRRTKAGLIVNLERVEIICRLVFSEMFFGKSKYAERYVPEDFDELDVSDLKRFHEANYGLNGAKIFVSGAIVAEAVSLLRKHLTVFRETAAVKPLTDFAPKSGTTFRKREGAVQSAIRVGLPALPRTAGDYVPFYLVNTILGGYFGSRLMQNIREEKGYTYGIGSSINVLKDVSYLVISTQTGAQHTEATLKEIELEVKLLITDLVPADELELVKNYIAGSLLRNFDGTFSRASLLKTMVMHGLDESYYANFLSRLYGTGQTKIRETAGTYFDPSSFATAIVGEGFDGNE